MVVVGAVGHYGRPATQYFQTPRPGYGFQTGGHCFVSHGIPGIVQRLGGQYRGGGVDCLELPQQGQPDAVGSTRAADG